MVSDMYTPESYLPGTSDNPKSGRRPKENKEGRPYLMLQNPFLDLAEVAHAHIPNPEEALMMKEEAGESIDEERKISEWMDFEPFEAEDVPSNESGYESFMDFSPIERKMNRALIPSEKARNPARKESSDRGVVRVQREANLTLKRKSSEKGKAA